MPISLIAFDAAMEGKSVRLQWSAEEERNTDFFTIEKTQDGRTFSVVGQTAAAGQSAPGEKTYYKLMDDEPSSGTSYYRLKTTDFDGATSLSHLVKVQSFEPKEWGFTLYPNPNAGERLTIQPSGLEEGEDLQLEIIDAQGRLLRTESAPNSGNAPYHFKLERALPSGAYLIRATTESGLVETKLLVVEG